MRVQLHADHNFKESEYLYIVQAEYDAHLTTTLRRHATNKSGKQHMPQQRHMRAGLLVFLDTKLI